MVNTPPFLLWLDFETTGLDPSYDDVLEACAIGTDHELQQLFVVQKVFPLLRSPQAMPDVVRQMHENSGLLAEASAAAVNGARMPETFSDFEINVLENIKRAAPPESVWHLAGSSVSFDRDFLRTNSRYKLIERLHYRILDISSLKVLASMWRPGSVIDIKNEKTHRAMADIRASIAELRHYRATILNV